MRQDWAHTRSVLMSVLGTLKKRKVDVMAHLKGVLDKFATDLQQDPFPCSSQQVPPRTVRIPMAARSFLDKYENTYIISDNYE
jgi:hypothetical protein